MDGPQRPWRMPGAGLALVAVLLLLTAVGVRALTEADLGSAPPAGEAGRRVVSVLLLIGLIAGLIGLALQRRRRARRLLLSGPTPPWWAPLATVAVLALGLLLVIMLFDQVAIELPDEPTTPPRDEPAGGEPGSVPAGTAALLALGCLLAALLTARLLTVRQKPVFPAAEDARPPEPWPVLQDALTSGGTALRDTDGPRQAIIACYAAMEDVLAAAGSPRQRADTPEELLRRGIRAGLLPPGPAETLTGLFREARFSTHPMTAEHRTAAAAALAALRAPANRVPPAASTVPPAAASAEATPTQATPTTEATPTKQSGDG